MLLFKTNERFRSTCRLINSRVGVDELETLLISAVSGKEVSDKNEIMGVCKYILDQAKFVKCSPAELGSFLRSETCGLDDQHAQIFEMVLSSGNVTRRLDEDNTSNNNNKGFLKDVEWELHVNMVDENCFQRRDCQGILHFKFDNDDIAMELTHEKLTDLFFTMERIQNELDFNI